MDEPRDPAQDVIGVMWRQARAQWPDVDVALEVFETTAAAVCSQRPRELTQLSAAELYIVAGCLQRDRAAFVAFERRYFPAIDAARRALGVGTDAIEEAKQQVRIKLFVPEPGKPPKILGYAGDGRLDGLVRAIAFRWMHDQHRATQVRRIDRTSTPLPDRESLDGAVARHTHAAQYRVALERAATSLPARDRLVLRLFHVEGLSLVQIARVLGTHPTTAGRALVSARDRLARAMRQDVGGALDSTSFRSVGRAVAGELDPSLDRYLADPNA